MDGNHAPGRVVAVDWSGARDASGVWLAQVDDGEVVRLEPPGSRERAVDLVIGLGAERRTVAGFDFAFSFPTWFVRAAGCADAPAFWDVVAERGEGWLARPEPPFWVLRTRAQGETGPRAYRDTDRAMAGPRVSPKSVFQLAGPGQVGTMSLRGMPLLRRLRAAGIAVWPFDDPGSAQSVVVEIYPRRLYGDAVVKGQRDARADYLAPYRPRLTAEQHADALANDHAFDALTAALAMWEHRSAFAALPPAAGDQRIEGRIWAP